jgi:hypothetical protein
MISAILLMTFVANPVPAGIVSCADKQANITMFRVFTGEDGRVGSMFWATSLKKGNEPNVGPDVWQYDIMNKHGIFLTRVENTADGFVTHHINAGALDTNVMKYTILTVKNGVPQPPKVIMGTCDFVD